LAENNPTLHLKFCSCDWTDVLELSYVTDKILPSYNTVTTRTNSVTLKMEAISSSELSEHIATKQCRILKEDQHLSVFDSNG
jgi:hypothetical protein